MGAEPRRVQVARGWVAASNDSGGEPTETTGAPSRRNVVAQSRMTCQASTSNTGARKIPMPVWSSGAGKPHATGCNAAGFGSMIRSAPDRLDATRSSTAVAAQLFSVAVLHGARTQTREQTSAYTSRLVRTTASACHSCWLLAVRHNNRTCCHAPHTCHLRLTMNAAPTARPSSCAESLRAPRLH